MMTKIYILSWKKKRNSEGIYKKNKKIYWRSLIEIKDTIR